MREIKMFKSTLSTPKPHTSNYKFKAAKLKQHYLAQLSLYNRLAAQFTKQLYMPEFL